MMGVLFGYLIYNRRQELQITRSELAKSADVSESYIYAIESGRRGNDLIKITRIARVLELCMEQVVHAVLKDEENKQYHNYREMKQSMADYFYSEIKHQESNVNWEN